MILQIDMGNTRIKWRLQEQLRTLSEGLELTGNGWGWLKRFDRRVLKSICVSSVLSEDADEALAFACSKLGYPTPVFARSLPEVRLANGRLLVNGYDQPELLGVDRWMGLLAARALTEASCVVVDAGSAMTVDVLNASGRHLGGYVAPGLKMMRASLRGGTAGLVGAVDGLIRCDFSVPGTNTQAGVDAALLQMGRGLICSARKCASSDVLYITGGDAAIWAAMFDDAVLVPEMVLDGVGCYFESVGCGSWK